MSARAAPPAAHAGPVHSAPPSRTAVVLVNLGTPEVPTTAAVRRYLAQFLRDPRVVELPRLLWWPVLYGLVLPLRAARVARKYASIWMGSADVPLGSPLRHYTQRQAQRLEEALERGAPQVVDASGQAIVVRYAMRYGNPSLASVLSQLRREGAGRILVLPLYPQYAAATSASVADELARWLRTQRWQPQVRCLAHYHDAASYIAALAASVRAHWSAQERAGRERAQVLLMSFHGLPERASRLGDPYCDECLRSAHLLAQALGLTQQQYRLTFQSRFGPAQWLQPYTLETAVQLARDAVQRVDVICPGFASDCLDTLEEIDQGVRSAFLAAGGVQWERVPCLNDSEPAIAMLRALVLEHLAGWLGGAQAALGSAPAARPQAQETPLPHPGVSEAAFAAQADAFALAAQGQR